MSLPLLHSRSIAVVFALLAATYLMTGCGDSVVGDEDEETDLPPPSFSWQVEGQGSVRVEILETSTEDTLQLLLIGIPNEGWYLDRWNADSTFTDNPAVVTVTDSGATATALFQQAVEPTYFDDIPFVEIPTGTFDMGTDGGHGRQDETPKHSVTISKPFYLSMYEITLETWLEKGGQNLHTDHNNLPQQPIVMVDWDEVQEWIDGLNEDAGADLYRLPTEAEWEYACLAGATGDRYFGEEEALSDHAWHFDNWPRYAGIAGWDREYQPVRVGLKRPNPHGLFDMLGNVWEWTQDAYDADYYSVSPSTDPQGPHPDSTDRRVIRGGGDDEPELGYLRCTIRETEARHEGQFYNGFRLVREKQ